MRTCVHMDNGHDVWLDGPGVKPGALTLDWTTDIAAYKASGKVTTFTQVRSTIVAEDNFDEFTMEVESFRRYDDVRKVWVEID